MILLNVWLCADEYSPYMGRRTSSSLSLTNGSASPRVEPSGSQSVPQRKRLLKAPSLAELDSSDSDVSIYLCVCGSFVKLHPVCAEQIMIEVLVYSIYIYIFFRMRLLGADQQATPVWLRL